MTRDKENRRLAEFADVQIIMHDFGPTRSCCRRCSIGIEVARSEICYPDFYTDEAANALLREKLRLAGCRIQIDKEVFVWGPLIGGDDVWAFCIADMVYLTAIVKASLAYLEREK